MIPVFDPGLPEENEIIEKREETYVEYDEKDGHWQNDTYAAEDKEVWPDYVRRKRTGSPTN